jgi:aminopeptidase N
VLNVTYSTTPDSVYVTVEQKHNTDKPLLYQLPAKIAVWYGSDVSSYDVVIKKKTQTFSFKAKGTPDLIDFDPEHAVLCERKDNKTPENYVFEYKHGMNYYEKAEALNNLGELQDKNPEAKQVLIAALTDSFYHFREFAINKLELPKDSAESIITVYENIATKDVKSSVRAAAINAIGKLPNASKYETLFETSVGDSSFQVSAAALTALSEADSKKAMEIASHYEGEKNATMVGAVAGVYAKEGDAHYEDYFEKKLHNSTGYAKYQLFYYYANFLIRMDKNVALNGIEVIEKSVGPNDSHFIAGAAKGALKRITKSFEDKKHKNQLDMAAEPDKTAKLGYQEKAADYDAIIDAANDALSRMNNKGEKKN